MTTQQQPNPEHQVLDVIAPLIDEQLAAGEPTVPAERHCRCGQLRHGLPIGACPGTPAAGESVHRFKRVRGLGGHGVQSATCKWRIVVSAEGFHLPTGRRRHWLKVSPNLMDPVAASGTLRWLGSGSPI